LTLTDGYGDESRARRCRVGVGRAFVCPASTAPRNSRDTERSASASTTCRG
jgi:hypothetical protein